VENEDSEDVDSVNVDEGDWEDVDNVIIDERDLEDVNNVDVNEGNAQEVDDKNNVKEEIAQYNRVYRKTIKLCCRKIETYNQKD
jgi:hypothetical protein